MSIVLTSAKIITPSETLKNSSLLISDSGRIEFVGAHTNLSYQAGAAMDLKGKTIIPGMIDIHVHGGNSITFGDDDGDPKNCWNIPTGLSARV